MKYFKSLTPIFIICGLFLTLAGCFSPTYVKRDQYLLNPHTFTIKQIKTHKNTIAINAVAVVAPFDQLSFIYRISANRYLTDYYNSFAISLVQQFNPWLLNYSYALGNFTPLNQAELQHADYQLQPVITQFYADYRDRNHPQAVVALNFKLFKHTAKEVKMIMNKNFTALIPIKVKDTEHLILAWQQGLENVTTRGIHALNQVFAK